MRDSNTADNYRYNELLNNTIRILKYDEQREQELHEELYKNEGKKLLYEGYIINTQYKTTNLIIDIACYRKMSDCLELFMIEPDLDRLDCLELIIAIHESVDYFVAGENSLFGHLEGVEVVANLVSFATIETINWLNANKHFLHGSQIKQIWIYGDKAKNRGNPYRLHPRHISHDKAIEDLKKIERGENWV